MKGRTLLVLAVLLSATMLGTVAHGATITWAAVSASPATDSSGAPLLGTATFGEPNFSNGSLVQLWLAVGEIDDPRPLMQVCGPPCLDTTWTIDDQLLDESHVGFGTFASDAGTWSHKSDYAVNEGDTVYVRAYNMTRPAITDITACPSPLEIGVANEAGELVFATVGDVRNPQTLTFDGLQTEPCVPEPASLLFLAPGLAIWALRRKK